jgi:inorganic triphosphatase YgiF
VYYDTDKHTLRKHGLMLRVRRSGRRYVQTIKLEDGTSSGLMNRCEWEHDVVNGKPNLTLVQDASLKSLLSKKLPIKLKPLFETRVRREVYPIRSGKSQIELTIDKGTVAVGRQSTPICELELELKRGNAAELFKVAHVLAEQVPVQLAVTSKSERGYKLITGEKTKPVGAAPVAISAEANCQLAFQKIAGSCLKQIIANQELARDGDSEGLHQTRVGLRRLRVAISLFGDMLRDPQSHAIKRELKWIAGELGPARELDVFMKRVVMPAVAGKLQRPGIAALARDLRHRRHEAFGLAASAIESDRFRMLIFDTAAWIDTGEWTSSADELVRALRDQPILTAAVAEMKRRRKIILKRGAGLVEIDPKKRHRIRIKAKKLRYASEFFGGAFPGKKARSRRDELVAALERLQDTLGDLNDISVHEELTERLAIALEENGGKSRSANKAFAAGCISGREEARVAPVLKDAERAYACFAKVKPFWR